MISARAKLAMLSEIILKVNPHERVLSSLCSVAAA
jgi:hypothetical protein